MSDKINTYKCENNYFLIGAFNRLQEEVHKLRTKLSYTEKTCTELNTKIDDLMARIKTIEDQDNYKYDEFDEYSNDEYK